MNENSGGAAKSEEQDQTVQDQTALYSLQNKAMIANSKIEFKYYKCSK